MKALVVGLVLLALGGVGLVYKGFSYESKETVAKIGSLEASAEVTKEVQIPQAVSIVLMVVGAGLVLVGFKK